MEWSKKAIEGGRTTVKFVKNQQWAAACYCKVLHQREGKKLRLELVLSRSH